MKAAGAVGMGKARAAWQDGPPQTARTIPMPATLMAASGALIFAGQTVHRLGFGALRVSGPGTAGPAHLEESCAAAQVA